MHCQISISLWWAWVEGQARPTRAAQGLSPPAAAGQV